MSSLFLLATCLVLGWLVARFGHPPASLAQNLNWWVINVAFPALVLHLAPQIRFDTHLWFLIAAQWFVFAGAWLLFASLGRALHWTRARIGALILVCGLGNTSFIGFPMVEALRGHEGLTLAVLGDQAGCFVALAVGGTIAAAMYSGHSVAPATIARRVLLFPPFVSLVVGVLVGALGEWPAALDAIFDRIGATLVPVALFSVGLQFQLHLGRQQLPAIGLGLAWKLLLAPLIAWTGGWLIGVEGLVLTIAVLQAAMAPMISAAILASQNELEPPLANTVLGVGILLAFITVPIANHWLG